MCLWYNICINVSHECACVLIYVCVIFVCVVYVSESM